MTQDRHQDFFDQLAQEWDLSFTAEDLERLTHIVDRLGVEPGMNVLDLGCGTGIMFDLLRRKVGPEGSVTGVDFSIEMAVKAHRNFPFPNVTVVDGDASSLPFRDAVFDMAVAFASFPHFSNQHEVVHEIHRVLGNGSRCYIIHLVSSAEINEFHHRLGGIVEHDEMPAADSLRAMFSDSQFQNIEIQDHAGLFLASAVNSR
jgi:demethylmenaquinone methyltransferase/2-methoxy-6-polyprenyl-1,4-benzoquinol methylase